MLTTNYLKVRFSSTQRFARILLGLFLIGLLCFSLYICVVRHLEWPISFTPYLERLKEKHGYDPHQTTNYALRHELHQLRPWLSIRLRPYMYVDSAFALCFRVQVNHKNYVRKLYWRRAHPYLVYPYFPFINNYIRTHGGRLFVLPTQTIKKTRQLELAEQQQLAGSRYTQNIECPIRHILKLCEAAWYWNIRVEDTAPRNIIYDKKKRVWWFWDCTDLRTEQAPIVYSWSVLLDTIDPNTVWIRRALQAALPAPPAVLSLVLRFIHSDFYPLSRCLEDKRLQNIMKSHEKTKNAIDNRCSFSCEHRERFRSELCKVLSNYINDAKN